MRIVDTMLTGFLAIPKKLDEQLGTWAAQRAREAMVDMRSRRELEQAVNSVRDPNHPRHGAA